MAKKQTVWTRNYNAKAYARLTVTVPKEQKQAIDEHARSKGESVNGLINKLLRQDMGLSEWPKKED